MCSKCLTPIKRETEPESMLKCNLCAEIFHPRCAGITKTFLKTIAPHKNFSWTCDECITQRDHFSAITNRLKDIETLLKSLESGQKCHEQEISDLKKSTQNGQNHAFNVTPLSTNKRSWADMVMETVNTRTPVSSVFSGAKKAKRHNDVVTTTTKSESILIIKAKKTPDRKRVKENINKVLHPLRDPVSRVRETSKGSVVVTCNDQESITVVKEKISEAMGADFERAAASIEDCWF